ncbi:hypothetical protein [Streptomyces sp. SAS_270]|uniref:hypothetical protein n=1 Tax=Streptomyces sp. SAS_270 TaxID=3412748 RepID=UPI00403D2A07
MFPRVQRNRTTSAEGKQQCPARPRRLLPATALTGSGLSGAALSWSLLGHSPMWAVAAGGFSGVLAVTGAAARHTPDLVRAWIWRLSLRAVLREVRQFAREDLLSAKITPQELMKLAGDVHQRTLENQPAEPRDDHGDDN